jgi:hypothetical protein
MKTRRIHVVGASGSGVTTLGRALADALALPHHSGGLAGWGAELVPCFNLVVFVRTPRELRMQRLRAREATHFGADVIAPGGWRHEETESFFEWASRYEDGTREGRSVARHEAWLATLPCPVLRLDGARPVSELVVEVCRALGA